MRKKMNLPAKPSWLALSERAQKWLLRGVGALLICMLGLIADLGEVISYVVALRKFWRATTTQDAGQTQNPAGRIETADARDKPPANTATPIPGPAITLRAVDGRPASEYELIAGSHVSLSGQIKTATGRHWYITVLRRPAGTNADWTVSSEVISIPELPNFVIPHVKLPPGRWELKLAVSSAPLDGGAIALKNLEASNSAFVAVAHLAFTSIGDKDFLQLRRNNRIAAVSWVEGISQNLPDESDLEIVVQGKVGNWERRHQARVRQDRWRQQITVRAPYQKIEHFRIWARYNDGIEIKTEPVEVIVPLPKIEIRAIDGKSVGASDLIISPRRRIRIEGAATNILAHELIHVLVFGRDANGTPTGRWPPQSEGVYADASGRWAINVEIGTGRKFEIYTVVSEFDPGWDPAKLHESPLLAYSCRSPRFEPMHDLLRDPLARSN